MSDQNLVASRPTYTANQYLLYIVIGFVIWVSGVILVRLLGSAVFSQDSPILLLFFGASIPFGILIQYLIPLIIRQPMQNMMIPIIVMVATTLMLDGIAITFTDIYSAETSMKMVVGGWLLWTFGTQLVVSLIVINRANNPQQ